MINAEWTAGIGTLRKQRHGRRGDEFRKWIVQVCHTHPLSLCTTKYTELRSTRKPRAFYDPVWTSSVKTTGDFSVALIGFVLLIMWRAPPALVVVMGALAGVAMAQIHA
jgi:hypothetical protein